MSGSEEDWFDRDEDEIAAAAGKQCKTPLINDQGIEYITDITEHPEPIVGSISTTAKNAGGHQIRTAELRKITKLSPLDAFLWATTIEPDFFVQQVAENDSQERVLLYMHILAMICELQLPGFHIDVLTHFATNGILMEHLRVVTAKLFNKRYSAIWADVERVAEIICDLQVLLLQANQAGLLPVKSSSHGSSILEHIWKLVDKSDSAIVAQLPLFLEFKKQLDFIMHSQTTPTDNTSVTNRLFPSLEELLTKDLGDQQPDTDEELEDEETPQQLQNQASKSVGSYIRTQKQLLREDFLIPLRRCIQQLQINETPPNIQLYEAVCIVFNEGFLSAHRHEMVFVDMLGASRKTGQKVSKSQRNGLANFKTGSLLCFTVSREFENLIMAKVTYTDSDMLRAGYIGIEVQLQYNVGNIYGKDYLMFETPAFFEPYSNVYGYLNSCGLDDFPMRDYIVFGNTKVKPPAYLTENTVYNYERDIFKPLEQDKKRIKNIPLDRSQLAAYKRALAEELCIIQGPPGTGKTHLSLYLVQTLMKNATTPIILITYTNDSLDKFLLELSALTDDIVRFGSQSRNAGIAKYNVRLTGDNTSVNPRLKHLWYVVNLEHKARFEEFQRLLHEFDGSEENYQQILSAQRACSAVTCKMDCLRSLFQYYLVREKGVIAMTSTCGAKMNFLFRLLKSSIVIFEEAAELLESHAVACMTPHTSHVIMVGDHMQLQPYTSAYQHGRRNKLNVSLFERLIGNVKPAVLTVQYRMRPIIATLLCPIFYDELNNDDVVESYPKVRKMSKNLYFVTHSFPEQKLVGESSISNVHEVGKIIELAMRLIQLYEPEDIVILSPYATQIELINKQIGTNPKLHNIRAATVDSFQGLEAKIILLSLVRSMEQGRIGFLKQKNRICVALSRAKHGLYIIGNMTFLAGKCETWKAIRTKLESFDAIGEEFPFDDDNDK